MGITWTDEADLNRTLEAIRPGIFALCYRLVGSLEDAEDLTQDVLLKISSGLDRFQGRSSLKTWAYRIATNTCYNFLKSARKRREVVVPDPLETSDAFLAQLDPTEDRERLRESLEFSFICVLQELSPLQRLVVVLRDVLGWSVRETAEALGSAPAPIKNIHSRARRRLRQLQGRRANLPPDDPTAEEFMRRFARAHMAQNLGWCLQFYDDESILHAFPKRKFVGRRQIRDFYAAMLDQMPTLFIAVKVNGTLGAACYHPMPEGGYRHTGVTIVEIFRPPAGRNRAPRVARAFWALEPEHYRRVQVPDVVDSAEEARELGALL